MIVTFTLGFSGLFSRSNVLDSEFKEKSIALAEGCADVAIARLQADEDYVPASPPGDEVNIGSDSCYIWSITAGGWPKTIRIQSLYPPTLTKKAYTNLEIVVSKPANKVIVNSWTEIPNLP